VLYELASSLVCTSFPGRTANWAWGSMNIKNTNKGILSCDGGNLTTPLHSLYGYQPDARNLGQTGLRTMLGGRRRRVPKRCGHGDLVLGPFFVLSAYEYLVAHELTNQQHVALPFHCFSRLFVHCQPIAASPRHVNRTQGSKICTRVWQTIRAYLGAHTKFRISPGFGFYMPGTCRKIGGNWLASTHFLMLSS